MIDGTKAFFRGELTKTEKIDFYCAMFFLIFTAFFIVLPVIYAIIAVLTEWFKK